MKVTIYVILTASVKAVILSNAPRTTSRGTTGFVEPEEGREKKSYNLNREIKP